MPDAIALPTLAIQDRLLDLRTDLIEQPRRRWHDHSQFAARLDIQAGNIDQHQEQMHVAAIAPRRVLVQVNRRVGQIPDAVAVPVSLPHEVGILSDILAAEVTD